VSSDHGHTRRAGIQETEIDTLFGLLIGLLIILAALWLLLKLLVWIASGVYRLAQWLKSTIAESPAPTRHIRPKPAIRPGTNGAKAPRPTEVAALTDFLQLPSAVQAKAPAAALLAAPPTRTSAPGGDDSHPAPALATPAALDHRLLELEGQYPALAGLREALTDTLATERSKTQRLLTRLLTQHIAESIGGLRRELDAIYLDRDAARAMQEAALDPLEQRLDGLGEQLAGLVARVQSHLEQTRPDPDELALDWRPALAESRLEHRGPDLGQLVQAGIDARLADLDGRIDARLRTLEAAPAGAQAPPQRPAASAPVAGEAIPQTERETLDRILDALGFPAGEAREALWSGEPAPLVLALRLAQEPRLAGIPPRVLTGLQKWLEAIPEAALALITPTVGERCDETLQEVTAVSNERVPFEHVVRVERLGLTAGGRVQLKARVDVHR